VVGAVGALHVHAELGRHDEPVAAPLQRRPQQLLALAGMAAVDVGGVEQGDADVFGGVQDPGDAVLVDPAAEGVGAETDRAHHQPGRAQRSVLHLHLVCHAPQPTDP
jgi:hypothetical protein